MTEEQKEAFEAVQTINEELYEKYGDECPTLIISFVSRMFSIELSIVKVSATIDIYNSENEDDRIYYAESDEFETFSEFIKRKFNRIKEKIYSIKL